MNLVQNAVRKSFRFFPQKTHIGGNLKSKILEKIQKNYNIILPISYQYYLKNYSYFRLNDFMPLGIINEFMLFDTGLGYSIKNDREFGFPHHIILISDIGDGSYYALDLSQMNEEQECPVVIWPVGGYDETPELEIVAPDFGNWFYDQVQEQIERLQK